MSNLFQLQFPVFQFSDQLDQTKRSNLDPYFTKIVQQQLQAQTAIWEFENTLDMNLTALIAFRMTDNKENQNDFAAKIAQAKVRCIFCGNLNVHKCIQ